MVDVPVELLPHSVAVRRYIGSGPYGDVFADTIAVRALVEDRRRLIFAASGEEFVSETTVYIELDVDVPVVSQVTMWAGRPYERTARVTAASRYEHPGVLVAPGDKHWWRRG